MGSSIRQPLPPIGPALRLEVGGPVPEFSNRRKPYSGYALHLRLVSHVPFVLVRLIGLALVFAVSAIWKAARMAEDLRVLAADYVRLSSEIEDLRRRMLSALTNGAAANPIRPVRTGGGHHPKGREAKAAEAEAEILELLKGGPKRMAEIGAATEAKQSTLSVRLRRLRQRGLAAPVGGGAWAAWA